MTLRESLEEVREYWAVATYSGLQRAEREAVIRALNDAGLSGMRQAANLLGVTVKQLMDLIHKHGIFPEWKSRAEKRTPVLTE